MSKMPIHICPNCIYKVQKKITLTTIGLIFFKYLWYHENLNIAVYLEFYNCSVTGIGNFVIYIIE